MVNLHITNGDSAANIIKASAVTGDVLPWRDPMHHGPFPADLDLDSLSEVRGHYLAGFGVEASETVRGFKLRDDHLRAATKYEHVVLWFEHDLLDQLQILQLLNWFSEVDLGDTRLEMICIDTFYGIDPFRGIGQLDCRQMASLFEVRQPVKPAQLALAKSGWSAFRSADPCDLETFVSGDLAPLPYLQTALLRHLEEYPATRTGLTRTEAQILKLVADGVSAPGEIFQKNMELETVYFIGDWLSYRHIGDLCAGDDPLLLCGHEGPFWFPPQIWRGRDDFRKQKLRLSETGRRVLTGQQHAFGIVKRDQWLGGVHVGTGRELWTWNADLGRLQIREP